MKYLNFNKNNDSDPYKGNLNEKVIQKLQLSN